MSLITRTLAAFVAGSFVMLILTSTKSGRASYYLEIRPEPKARMAAGELLRRVGKYSAEENHDGSWKTVASREFAKDLARMNWTWNGQINWKDSQAPAPASPPP